MRLRTPTAGASPWAIPLVVGVTGHRDLCRTDVLEVEHVVQQVLADLQRRHPSTPLLLLSPLAEGADRLVARVALRNGLRLVVPLPMPPEDYVTDFVDAASREEFWALLKAAHASFVAQAPAAACEEETRESARDRRYAQAGAYVAQNCHLLLALWDGKARDRPGGTSELIKFRLHGFPEPSAPSGSALDVVDAGPVCHVLVRRVDSGDPATGAALRFLFPGGEEAGASQSRSLWTGELARLEKYNRDLLTASSRLTARVQEDANQVVPPDESSRLTAGAGSLLTSCAASDALATHYRDRYKRVTQALFSLGVLAVVAFSSHLVVTPVLLSLYPTLLLVGLLVYRLAKSTELQNRHLDYRALAEGFRVQLFWHLAGIGDDVSGHYLRKQRTELEWIRRALRAARMTACAFAPPPGGIERYADLILRRWIDRQSDFYVDASLRDRHTADRLHWWAVRLFVSGLFLAAAVAISYVSLPGASEWQDPAVAVMGIAPAAAAALLGYSERMVLRPQAKRYEWMGALFQRAAVTFRTLSRSGDFATAQHLLRELGRAALEENGDWLMGHRERPPLMPVG